MKTDTLDYLVIAAHPDDAELCVGGTILSLKAAGMRVGILDLTSGEPTPHGSPEIRARETAAANEILRVDSRHNLGLPNRSLTADLGARKAVASVLRTVRPRVLLSHFWEDAHPDHVAASELVDAARFWAKLSKTDMPGEPFFPEKIVYYFSMHRRAHINPSFIVDVSPHFENKLKAVAAYQSQFLEGRSGFLDQVRTQAAYWGYLIQTEYGEPLRVREEVGVSGLQYVR